MAEIIINRPDSERPQKELDTHAALNSLGIGFERVDHSPAATIEDCASVEAVLGAEICKNLFLCNRQQTEFFLLLMPGQKPFKTKLLSKQINSARLSFASAEDMLRLLNITPGSMSVFGLIFDKEKQVRLLIDKDLLKFEYLGFHPCINTSTLKLKTSDILGVLLPSLGVEPEFVELNAEESGE